MWGKRRRREANIEIVLDQHPRDEDPDEMALDIQMQDSGEDPCGPVVMNVTYKLRGS